MKSLITVLTALHRDRRSRSNLLVLLRMLALLAVMITLYAIAFHVLMTLEGQRHSWLTGFYWTFTVMTTLGFGDITFESDIGRAFSIIVMISGVLYLLVLLPFTFIEFFYAPWMKAQEAARAPRHLPAGTRGHVILTRHDPMAEILLAMLAEHHHPAWILCPTLAEALDLRDRGVPALTGDPNDPETWGRLQIGQAAMLVANGCDIANTNVTFTLRAVSETLPVVATASSDAACDALELAGVTEILRPEKMMAAALARRITGGQPGIHVIGNLDELVVAEVSAAHTILAGRTLAECQLNESSGVTIVGEWDQGQLVPIAPDTRFSPNALVLLAGSQPQIDAFNQWLTPATPTPAGKVIIIGGGLVGRATAAELTAQGVDWTIIERSPSAGDDHTLVGDAAEFDTLVRAGLHQAQSVIITTHDDETNLFLTIFFRRLRRKLQIICRCSHQSYVSKLHRAGANLVLSQASMTANSVFNHLSSKDKLLLAEGVYLFPAAIPTSLAGARIQDTSIRELTGCSILAIQADGQRQLNPSPHTMLPAHGTIILIGSLQAEQRFHEHYGWEGA